MGIAPYAIGLRRAYCCCIMYLCGCGCCGAYLPAQMRSEIRDFFGFGDGRKHSVEISDCCCWCFCPICCAVQEALHVDGALNTLPPPKKGDETVEDVEESEGSSVGSQGNSSGAVAVKH